MSRDRGSATVWATVAVTVLGAVFGGVLLLGQAVVARHRAGAAADLAALAAALTWARGPEPACAAASRVAGAQGAVVVGCRVGGEVVEVSARVRAGPFAPTVRARAGPPLVPEPPPALTRPTLTRPTLTRPARSGAAPSAVPVPVAPAPVGPSRSGRSPRAPVGSAVPGAGSVGSRSGVPGPAGPP
ncbi:Rv3654c family TadE-like protein [Streptomyces sp. NPDC048606]|uniref:Rv3654c family TadE-like protein n=1 Tax=Streptomyces sp. NPDC048606 TaxID=3154726 RepID=UPI00341B327F